MSPYIDQIGKKLRDYALVTATTGDSVSIPTQTFQKIPFSAGTLEGITRISSTAFQINTKGDYIINPFVGFDYDSNGERILIIYKNNNDYLSRDSDRGVITPVAPPYNGIQVLSFMEVLPLDVGDQIEIILYQDSGLTLSTTIDANKTNLSMSLIRPGE